MRACVYHQYGAPDAVMSVEEVNLPEVADDAALVRVHASSVNLDDLQYVKGEIFIRPGAIHKPKYPVLGSDIAGTVEAVGKNVTGVRPGDQVMADLTEFGFGGFAEFAAVPAGALAMKPAVSMEEAACLPTAGVRAVQAVTCRGPVRPGDKVLINGGGGGLGTFAIQIAKSFGAEVTGVDRTDKLDVMRDAGCDNVIDFTAGHYSESDARFDLIVDVAAYGSPADLRPILRSERVLTPAGKYVMFLAGGGVVDRIFTQLVLQSWMRLLGSRRMSICRGTPNGRESVEQITRLVETGTVRPVIDKVCSLDEVPDALVYVERGSARGKVVVAI
ncbi:MAG TPA: NAD(P)-dependent alcohol dehydrogenase [Actinomycetota bacterium]|nr:NAD(P)-dependent alcohol dehydrogenase [Actinomycetota bacterium]